MKNNQQSDSHLFTMRLWSEDLGDGQVEWRGKLRYVVSEEIRYFRDWSGLIALLQTMVQDTTLKQMLVDPIEALAPSEGSLPTA